MSQVVEATNKRSRLLPIKERVEAFLKTFEWTWANAITFSFAVLFFLMVTTSVMPSFWLYFADQKLKWDGGGPNGTILKILRDAVAMGLASGPLISILVVGAIMQNWRRKLRGQSDSRPTGGYR